MTDEKTTGPLTDKLTVPEFAGSVALVRAFTEGDVVFIENDVAINSAAIEHLDRWVREITKRTGVSIAVLAKGMRIAGAERRPIGMVADHDPPYKCTDGTWSLPVRDDPLQALRWICNKCTTVNPHGTMSCSACWTLRYPMTSAPIAWYSPDNGNVLTHEAKTNYTPQSDITHFAVPLYAHPPAVAATLETTECTYTHASGGLMLTGCGHELHTIDISWEFCPYCSGSIVQKDETNG